MIRPATADTIARAAEILRRGGLVAFPTETVYGLGADATSDEAVARIFEAKNRPTFNPLIVHVPGIAEAERLVRFTPLAEKLAAAFWPGPLSLVLERKEGCPVSLLVSAGLDTIAIRVPAQATARALLEAAQIPVAAPSANASGEVSPTLARHVEESLGNAVELIVDDGPCTVGVESTVADCTGDVPVILRPGGVTAEEIEAVAGRVRISTGSPDAPASPGMLESHYAPAAHLRLEATTVSPDEALLAFGPAPLGGAKAVRNLSASGDLREAAANLFAMLRELDALADAIAVMPVPETGLGRAVNDRLRRAAAPRPGR